MLTLDCKRGEIRLRRDIVLCGKQIYSEICGKNDQTPPIGFWLFFYFSVDDCLILRLLS
jgi:hypothetical protein